MSEVMRWKLKGFLPGVEGMSKAVMKPFVVLASDYDALAAQRDEGLAREAELQRRLTEAEKLSVHFESCNFQGLNPDGSEPFIYEHLPNGFKRVIGVRMQGWYCQGPMDRPGCADGEKS